MQCWSLLLLCAVVATFVTARPSESINSVNWYGSLNPRTQPHHHRKRFEDGWESSWLPDLLLNFHRPVVPDIEPAPDVEDLPANYDNSTREVKVVNGSRVEVNTTIIKHTDNNSMSFLHEQMVEIRPNNDGSESETPRVLRNANQHSPPAGVRVPAHLRQKPDDSNEDIDPNSPAGVRVPAYLRQKPDDSDEDIDPNSPAGVRVPAYLRQEQDDSEEDMHPPPDLSSDTRVNYVFNNLTIDPDAEIFDLGLVNKEAKQHDKDD